MAIRLPRPDAVSVVPVQASWASGRQVVGVRRPLRAASKVAAVPFDLSPPSAGPGVVLPSGPSQPGRDSDTIREERARSDARSPDWRRSPL